MPNDQKLVDIPRFGWSWNCGTSFPETWDQDLRPSPKQMLQLLPLSHRYVAWYSRLLCQRKKPNIDQFRMKTGKQMYGVPLGGIGAGTIGRGFRGEFCRFQMIPGVYKYHVVEADQFVIVVRDQEEKCLYHSVLAAKSIKPKKTFSGLEWNIEDSQIQYHALYPRAWTVYDIPDQKLRVTCHQVSPFIPHNYKDSSLPVAVFEWTVENLSDDDRSVSILQVFKNGWGSKTDKAGKCQTAPIDRDKLRGAMIHQEFRGLRLTYGIGVMESDENNVTWDCSVDPNGNGTQVLGQPASPEGRNDLGPNEEIAVAVQSRCFVAAQSSAVMVFSLTWDMPLIKFRDEGKIHTRRYAKWFGKDGTEDLLEYALVNYSRWIEEIQEWQTPILEDSDLPDWFKSALFNEMYFIADGGSQWLEADDKDLDAEDPRKTHGRFGYLESHEYRMYNTYDVHFYASFALVSLFPQLQLSIQADFCDATTSEDSEQVKELYGGKLGPRKIRFAVPHDLGDPEEEPFIRINSYRIHDVSEWRDLNLKFVVSMWRDLKWTDNSFLAEYAYDKCMKAMERATEFDTDGDGLIENSGTPDQTYDSWIMQGPSAYCGGLWLAALACSVEYAKRMGKEDDAKRWQEMLDRAKPAFYDKLWNGEYFDFDSSSANSKTIFSDQLCGHWYLKLCGFGNEIFYKESVDKTLKTIFDNNVTKFCEGKRGAVNGMRPEGVVDRTTIQERALPIKL